MPVKAGQSEGMHAKARQGLPAASRGCKRGPAECPGSPQEERTVQHRRPQEAGRVLSVGVRGARALPTLIWTSDSGTGRAFLSFCTVQYLVKRP